MAKRSPQPDSVGYVNGEHILTESIDGLFHYECSFFKECSRMFSLEHSEIQRSESDLESFSKREPHPTEPSCTLLTVKTMISAPLTWLMKNGYSMLEVEK